MDERLNQYGSPAAPTLPAAAARSPVAFRHLRAPASPLAVCLSLAAGTSEQGIAIFRFANRIPLLFEGGGDVATQARPPQARS